MEPTLVFLPGLGADHRLFENQTAEFPNSYAVDWIDPLLPIWLTNPDIRIKGGGHLLVLNHPAEVNEAIRKFFGEHFPAGG